VQCGYISISHKYRLGATSNSFFHGVCAANIFSVLVYVLNLILLNGRSIFLVSMSKLTVPDVKEG